VKSLSLSLIMDTSFVEFNDDQDCRSSSESSVGFSFSSAAELKKNLIETFEKHVDLSNARSSSFASRASLSVPVVDRIAQFEVATTASSKPPRPLRPPSNIIPENRVSVYLRVRPPSHPGSIDNSSPAYRTLEVLKPKHPNTNITTVRTYPPPKSRPSHTRDTADVVAHAKEFEFSQVLGPETTQEALYATVAAPLIRSLFRSCMHNAPHIKQPGESALLFSYGITNAGKTHTILGDLKSKNEGNRGVIPRALSDIFSRMKREPISEGCLDVYISVFEIYNDSICDLMPKKNGKQTGPPPSLKVREHSGRTVIQGLARYKLTDAKQGVDLVLSANDKRRTFSNNINSSSSRSHCICQIQIVPRSCNLSVGPSDDEQASVSTRENSVDEEESPLATPISTLWIVDLAGSERSKRTALTSKRQKESSMINKSLMTLMRCLTVMRETRGQRSGNVVPFRESKLTHVFMSHLSGSSAFRTAMVVNVNPTVADFDETQHVLSYASRARLIRLDHEDLEKKRKLHPVDEYNLNGRKRPKVAASSTISSTKTLLSRVAKKLSPKKLSRKLSPRKNGVSKNDTRKAIKCKPSDRKLQASEGLGGPSRKHDKLELQLHLKNVATLDSHGEMDSLRESLAVAQANIKHLRAEKNALIEEFRRQEIQIREEVSQEMEERLRLTRERNLEEIEKLRSGINLKDIPCRSLRKAQMDNAEKYVEELIDKVAECEEEMNRMRKTHAEEIAALGGRSGNAQTGHGVRGIKQLEDELAAAKEQTARLEKSKIELIQNYEALLGGHEEAGEASSCLKNNAPHLVAGALRPKLNHAGSNQMLGSHATVREPLGTISGNMVSEQGSARLCSELKAERWIFPTKPSGRDESGTYRKPPERAPCDREWDGSVGAWRLNPVRRGVLE